MSDALVEFRGVRKLYRARGFAAVDGVDLAIPKGRIFGLAGESGSGKSTLGRMAVGLTTPSSGEVMFDGQRLDRATFARAVGRLQMVYQDPQASLNPTWRIGNIVGEPIRRHAMTRTQRRDRVVEVLEQVGLGATDTEKLPREFSGGQRQRIAIARALVGRPDFLVCDEPTSALDVSVQAQVLNLIRRLQAELKLTCLFISHDFAVIANVADQIGIMRNGRLVEQGKTESVLGAPAHPYTKLLLDAARLDPI